MEALYFPKELYIQAHYAYLIATGKHADDVRDYCLKDQEFFVEVVFSYIDGLPFPKMKHEV